LFTFLWEKSLAVVNTMKYCIKTYDSCMYTMCTLIYSFLQISQYKYCVNIYVDINVLKLVWISLFILWVIQLKYLQWNFLLSHNYIAFCPPFIILNQYMPASISPLTKKCVISKWDILISITFGMTVYTKRCQMILMLVHTVPK
jgi:hypothetical protein